MAGAGEGVSGDSEVFGAQGDVGRADVLLFAQGFYGAFLAYFCGFDTLDAVGAFFHDAAHADGDVRVALEVRATACLRFAPGAFGKVVFQEGVVLVEVEVVEASYLVGAVVGAVPGSGAAGVCHGV